MRCVTPSSASESSQPLNFSSPHPSALNPLNLSTPQPLNLIPLASATPETSAGYNHDDPQIASAISRAQENLLRQQHPDGHWCGELLVDSTLCSDYVLFMHWLREGDGALQQRGVRHILKRQLWGCGVTDYSG